MARTFSDENSVFSSNTKQIDGIDVIQSPDARGVDAIGANTYTTLLTPSKNVRHIKISLGGVNDAIISLDAGTTEHIRVPSNSIIILDDVEINSGVAIQGKNETTDNNYSNLDITIW